EKPWPLQTTWRQAVGGELFFPEWFLGLEHDWTQDYRQRRNETLWALFFAAHHNHALAAAYLFREVRQINSDVFISDCPLETWALERALESLKTTPQTPEACYAIGMCFLESGFQSMALIREVWGEDHDGPVHWFEKAGNLKAKFALLKYKAIRRVNVTAQDYLALASKGYGPAISESLKHMKDEAAIQKLLVEACSRGINIAKLEQALHYPDMETCEKACVELGKKGMPAAYLKLGEKYVGGKIREPIIDNPENVSRAQDAMMKAGKDGHPLGFRYWIRLEEAVYQDQIKQTKRKSIKAALEEEFAVQLLSGPLKSAMELGFMVFGKPYLDSKTKHILEQNEKIFQSIDKLYFLDEWPKQMGAFLKKHNSTYRPKPLENE
ncbi:MAG: hypothetical protein ACRCUQ_04300, partial [Alphaproteobacteria bacterium]